MREGRRGKGKERMEERGKRREREREMGWGRRGREKLLNEGS